MLAVLGDKACLGLLSVWLSMCCLCWCCYYFASLLHYCHVQHFHQAKPINCHFPLFSQPSISPSLQHSSSLYYASIASYSVSLSVLSSPQTPKTSSFLFRRIPTVWPANIQQVSLSKQQILSLLLQLPQSAYLLQPYCYFHFLLYLLL